MAIPPMRTRRSQPEFAGDNRDFEALREFRQAMPVVLSAAQDVENDDTVNAAARELRTRMLTGSLHGGVGAQS